MRLLLLCLLSAASLASSGGAPPEVQTKNGKVRGYWQDSVAVFKGIPFGEDTSGKNRWMPPVPAKPWQGTLEATAFGPSCPQICKLPFGLCPSELSEDCLHLNIWTPSLSGKNVSGNALPVMVFLYGGAFFQGTASAPIYEADYLAARGVIVVTGEYRVGVLGFLVSGDPSKPVLNGNYGFKDQQLLLHWVQDNIGAFGGDPARVTLFGESAGAISCAAHMITPSSYGLYHQQLWESNPPAIEFPTMKEAANIGNIFVGKTPCEGPSDLNCLRALSFSEVVKLAMATWTIPDPIDFTLEWVLVWQPTVNPQDPQAPPQKQVDAFRSGDFNAVPLVHGTNQNEGILFVFEAVSFLDDIEYVAAVTAIFKEEALRVLIEYPPVVNPIDNMVLNFAKLITDYCFACANRATSAFIAAKKTGPSWLYHYDHILSFPAAYGRGLAFCAHEVCHGSELPFVFGHSGMYNMTAKEREMSDRMQSYWTNFAISGNPNEPAKPAVVWPAWTPSKMDYLHIGVGTSMFVEPNYDIHYCDFWDKISCNEQGDTYCF